MIDYYRILNISQDASLDEIKKAYRKLAKKYHPDNYTGSEKEASDHMSEINEAYDVLMDKTKRFLYNQEYKQRDACEKNTSTENAPSRGNSTPKKKTSSNVNTTFHEKSFSAEEGTASHKKTFSSTEKTTFHKKSSPPPTYGARSQNGCVGCFGKVLKYCLFLIVVFFLVKHFHLWNRIESFIKQPDISQNSDKETSDESPENSIKKYFDALRESDINTAATLLKDYSYSEATKTISDLYQAVRKNDRYYQIFKEIPKFTMHCDAVNCNSDKTKAEIAVTIQNIDCYKFMAFLFTSFDSGAALESLSQEELDLAISDMLENKANYSTASVCVFEMEKTDELWKISKISDIDVMTSVLIGKVDLLNNATDSDE